LIPSSVIVVDNSDHQLPSTRFVVADLADVCRSCLLTRPVIVGRPVSPLSVTSVTNMLVKKFECFRRDRLPVSSSVFPVFTMADHRLVKTTRITDSSQAAEVGSSTISKSGPATRILSSDASAMARFSLDLRELKAANALGTLGAVSETQWLSTQAIMQELSTDSEVTFRREFGSAEILPTRLGIDPLEDTRPMPNLSRISQSPITASPSVIARS